ncbi:hypothetical protein F9L07_07455 [Pimelobacter simplex]|uniref:Uncharacterized protein n=1 Tax=Nocardioides simplex TaxID=2045 RepID=A0A7J5E0F8_NOCSI|nr:hypothetical protein [Pimelobacter simplex]KAB2811689.1 hypothetical protein F9L07_07455 [Pimelobacter simplex]
MAGHIKHGPDRHRHPGLGQPLADLLGADRGLVPPADRVGAGPEQCRLRDVHVEHGPAARRALRAEIEREVVAGEVAEGLGAAHVQARLVPEPAEQGGAAADRLVEVRTVGGVEEPVDAHQSVGVGRADLDVAVVARRRPLGLIAGGVEPDHCLGDQPLELGPADSGGVEQLPVHERGGLRAERPGGLRDPFSAPGRQTASDHRGVDLREAPRTLQHPADVHPTAIR